VPATVVVGGQFGSEGKGKVALHLARQSGAAAIVRVGGPNSGHTVIAANGKTVVLRQLPVCAVLPDQLCVIGPGSYVDPGLVLEEIARLGLTQTRRVRIDPAATIIKPEDRDREIQASLGERLGSTISGTTGAVLRRVERHSRCDLAEAEGSLEPYLDDTTALMRGLLTQGKRIIVEGTQGFGLSLLHSPYFPYATARDTTAAAATAEAGLSPLDVDDVVLVIRTFPIRVAGNSGGFGSSEVAWSTIAAEAGLQALVELTSVTGRVRRVARFDAELVKQAIMANAPSTVVLNHLD
jgi:adenylosuccinate synthase